MAGTSAIYPGCAAVVSRTQLPRNSVLVMASLPASSRINRFRTDIPQALAVAGERQIEIIFMRTSENPGKGFEQEFGEVGVG